MDESKNGRFIEPFLEDCDIFPYDASDTPCNLLGWQSFAYQSLTQTKKGHDASLSLLKNELKQNYKKLILLSHRNESIEVRVKATSAMFNLSKTHSNNFGQFFHVLATYNELALANEKSAIRLKAKLRKVTNKNTKLKTELKSAQSKIEAIIDIEKHINTN